VCNATNHQVQTATISWEKHKKINRSRGKKKNQIKFQKQKQTMVDQVGQQMSHSVICKDNYERSIKMEYSYHDQISLEFNKKLLLVADEPHTITKTKEKMKMLIYEQIIPNWTALFMLICNHLCICNKYEYI